MNNKIASTKELPHWFTQNVAARLKFLYGENKVHQLMEQLINLLLAVKTESVPMQDDHWNQQDIILITYGDSIQQVGNNPLQTLYEFLSLHLRDSINSIHILPYFPYSSDDGFAVIDYKTQG